MPGAVEDERHPEHAEAECRVEEEGRPPEGPSAVRRNGALVVRQAGVTVLPIVKPLPGKTEPEFREVGGVVRFEAVEEQPERHDANRHGETASGRRMQGSFGAKV